MDEGSRESILLPGKWFVIARDAFNGYQLESAAIRPDGREIAAGHRDGRVELWRNAKRSAVLRAQSQITPALDPKVS